MRFAIFAIVARLQPVAACMLVQGWPAGYLLPGTPETRCEAGDGRGPLCFVTSPVREETKGASREAKFRSGRQTAETD